MGHFLLFSEHGRLIATREVALAPGAVDPETVFPGARGVAVELHPALLLKVRPPVWDALVGHAARHRDGVRVDDLATIRVHIEQRTLRQAEHELVEAACRVAMRDGAARLLQDGLPPSERDLQERLRQDMRRLELRVDHMRRGLFEGGVTIPPMLAELAGKVLPL